MPVQNSNSLFMSPTDENDIKQILVSLQPMKGSRLWQFEQPDINIFGDQIALPIAIIINSWGNSTSGIENWK